MKTDKIREALLDLERQKDVLEQAIQSLKTVLVRLNGHADNETMPQLFSAPLVHFALKPSERKLSYVNATVQVLKMGGRPMHIKSICQQIKILRGDRKDLKRQSVESTLLRHIQMKGEEAKIKKVSPGFYALPTMGTLEQYPTEEARA